MLVVEDHSMSALSREHYIRALAALVPYCNPTLPPVPPHLRKILNICKRRWIRDFLFNDDPTHLQVLTVPHYKQNAVACEISVSRYQPSFLSTPYQLAYNSSVVFIPAFSVDDISVGFGIDEKSYACRNRSLLEQSPSHDQFSSQSRRSNIDQFRYVRDDTSGILIMLYDHGQYYQIEFLSHINTRARQWSSSRFHRRALLDLLWTDSNLPNEPALMRAMICLQYIDEFRNCPSCGRTPQHECNCSLLLEPPRHSLDFSNHPGQLATHTGDYQGIVHLIRYSEGQQKCGLTLGNSISIKPAPGSTLVNRLTDYILSRDLTKWPYELSPVTTSTSFQNVGTEFVPSSSFPLLQGSSVQAIEQGSSQFMPGLDDGGLVSSAMLAATTPLIGPSEARLETPNVSLTLEEQEAQREKELKLERKKARNRASAHRSNMKKKAENEMRKANLGLLRQREAELRARERSLREENLRLRDLLYGDAAPDR